MKISYNEKLSRYEIIAADNKYVKDNAGTYFRYRLLAFGLTPLEKDYHEITKEEYQQILEEEKKKIME